jgi:plasmid maintenance system antidote protein VapI
MSELARIANQLLKLDSLIFRSNRELQNSPESEALVLNIPGMDALRNQLKRRFELIAHKQWMDVCNYRFHAETNDFLPVRQIIDAVGGFQHTIGLTMDAQMHGKPKDTGRLSKGAFAESVLRLGYCDGGDLRGDVGITLVAENRRDLMDSMNLAVDTVITIAESTDTSQVYNFSQKLGVAPIRAFSEWCHNHVRAEMGSKLTWVRNSKIQRVLTKTPEDWKNLKETIDLVSDSLTEDVEIDGILIAVNFKTKAFVIQSDGEYISGRFRENVISKNKAAEIPKDYHFILKKTVRRNLATDRVSTEHLLVNLVPPSGP